MGFFSRIVADASAHAPVTGAARSGPPASADPSVDVTDDWSAVEPMFARELERGPARAQQATPRAAEEAPVAQRHELPRLRDPVQGALGPFAALTRGDRQPRDGQPRDGQPRDGQPRDGQPRLPDDSATSPASPAGAVPDATPRNAESGQLTGQRILRRFAVGPSHREVTRATADDATTAGNEADGGARQHAPAGHESVVPATALGEVDRGPRRQNPTRRSRLAPPGTSVEPPTPPATRAVLTTAPGSREEPAGPAMQRTEIRRGEAPASLPLRRELPAPPPAYGEAPAPPPVQGEPPIRPARGEPPAIASPSDARGPERPVTLQAAPAAALPRVHIGRLEVIVLAPREPTVRPSPTGLPNLSSRRYLRNA
jgi:hypothetical protein